jgi:hypothetical protein
MRPQRPGRVARGAMRGGHDRVGVRVLRDLEMHWR